MTPDRPANAPLAAIAAALRAHRRFAILGHLRPDGDALGCQLAAALCLGALGKEIRVWNEDGMLDKYRFLPGSELVTAPPAAPEDFDVVLALDTAVKQRLGTALAAVRSARLVINIDHHITNEGYGDLVHIDAAAPATAQILFELFHGHGLPLDADIAANLFVALSTDTGSFQYPQTGARTFEVAAELTRRGAAVGRLSQQVYDSFPRRRLELLRELLATAKFTAGDRVASFALPAATAARLGVKPEDNEGLIDHLRAVEGVVAAAFFEELADGKIRVSLRSKDAGVDVSRICAAVGGGGHTLAAGARVRGGLADVEQRILDSLSHAIDSR